MAKKKEFIVSISSFRGGGRSIVQAETAINAAKAATRKKFGTTAVRKLPRNLSIIVTDTTKKKNAQSFFGNRITS